MRIIKEIAGVIWEAIVINLWFSIWVFGMIFILWFLTSCATYPNQSKVIKPRSEAKATFR